MKTNQLKRKNKSANSNVKSSGILFRKIISGVAPASINKIYNMSGAMVHEPEQEHMLVVR